MTDELSEELVVSAAFILIAFCATVIALGLGGII